MQNVFHLGTSIKSNIKIVSIEKALTNPKEAIIYTNLNTDYELITNIKYKNGNELLYMYDEGIKMVQNETVNNITEFDSNVIFASIDLTNKLLKISTMSNGIFNSETLVKIIDLNNNSENDYKLDGTPRSIKAYDSKIALNLGAEVHFINSNGWLIKRYSSSQEVKDVTISNDIAGIIFKDRVEIIKL